MAGEYGKEVLTLEDHDARSIAARKQTGLDRINDLVKVFNNTRATRQRGTTQTLSQRISKLAGEYGLDESLGKLEVSTLHQRGSRDTAQYNYTEEGIQDRDLWSRNPMGATGSGYTSSEQRELDRQYRPETGDERGVRKEAEAVKYDSDSRARRRQAILRRFGANYGFLSGNKRVGDTSAAAPIVGSSLQLGSTILSKRG